jgi:hypothetical protein
MPPTRQQISLSYHFLYTSRPRPWRWWVLPIIILGLVLPSILLQLSHPPHHENALVNFLQFTAVIIGIKPTNVGEVLLNIYLTPLAPHSMCVWMIASRSSIIPTFMYARFVGSVDSVLFLDIGTAQIWILVPCTSIGGTESDKVFTLLNRLYPSCLWVRFSVLRNPRVLEVSFLEVLLQGSGIS